MTPRLLLPGVCRRWGHTESQEMVGPAMPISPWVPVLQSNLGLVNHSNSSMDENGKYFRASLQ